MTIQTVRRVVADFLSNSEPGVLVIKGAWGTGKTHTWNDLLTANRDQLKVPRYAYVSLFGLRSVSELRLALVAKSVPTKFIGKNRDWATINREWDDYAKGHLRRFSTWLPRIQKAIPHVKDISISFDSVAGYLLKETIICLDDWERTQIGSKGLLGLISELKTEKRCKVILIFNDGKLDERRTRLYREYREKLVDIELVFSPTSQESIDIVIGPGVQYADWLRDAILRLNISNVRVIRKIQKLVDLLDKSIGKSHANVQRKVVFTAVLFTWLHYGEDIPGKPSLDFVRGWNRLGAALGDRKSGADPQHEQWAAILGAYDYDSSDELNLAVDQVVERGYIEGETLDEQIQAHEQMWAAADKQDSFNRAWELFHGSFDNNEQQVIDALANGLRESVHYVSPVNLNGTIEVLRQLKQHSLADELIDFYIDHRKKDEHLFNLAKNTFGGRVTDLRIRERFNSIRLATVQLPSLHDAVMAAARNRGWTEEEDQVMKAATAEALYDLILCPDGPRFLQACAWMATVNGWESFRDNLHEALTKIASNSSLNAARVARFGITSTPPLANPSSEVV